MSVANEYEIIADATSVVRKLNSELYKATTFDELPFFCGFSLVSNGYDCIVKYCGEVVFSSVDDYREVDSSNNPQPPLEQHILQMARLVLESASNVTSLCKD